MKAKEIAKVKQGVLQVPMTAGAIAVAYHNQDCNLKLTQPLMYSLVKSITGSN